MKVKLGVKAVFWWSGAVCDERQLWMGEQCLQEEEVVKVREGKVSCCCEAVGMEWTLVKK